jgi:hypothetical protein
MSENSLPHFDSTAKLVEFFETHDLGEFDLPEVEFDVNLEQRSFFVEVHNDLMQRLMQAAQRQHTSTEELVNHWLEEQLEKAA